MSLFLDHLGVDYIDGRTWRVQSPLIYRVGALEADAPIICVPAGFITDFASIPRPLWSIFPPTQFGKGAVIHDYLYRGGIIVGQKEAVSRGQADGTFREAIQVEGCSAAKARIMWLGLRAGGHWAWNNGHRRSSR